MNGHRLTQVSRPDVETPGGAEEGDWRLSHPHNMKKKIMPIRFEPRHRLRRLEPPCARAKKARFQGGLQPPRDRFSALHHRLAETPLAIYKEPGYVRLFTPLAPSLAHRFHPLSAISAFFR
uniref:Uncharacterized protein n=1 Tax=Steinernema glaseri TaxID=37863 RepID=A0A1I7YSM5_9BILA